MNKFNISLNSTNKQRLLDLVILQAYRQFWGLSPELELRAEVIRRQLPPELDLEKLKRYNGLFDQLRALEDYIKNVLNDPYCGDMGVGGSPFMQLRYQNRNRFSRLTGPIRASAVSMYVDLWRVILVDLLPKCSEKRQSELSVESTTSKQKSPNVRSKIETQILMEKYPHFYELLRDKDAKAIFLLGLNEVSGCAAVLEDLEPTKRIGEHFGIDSLDACELAMWYEREFEIPPKKMEPIDDSLGELARLIMTYRTN